MYLRACISGRRRPGATALAIPALTLAFVASIALPVAANGDDDRRSHGLNIETLSAKPYLVSGGDVLVRIDLPRNASPRNVKVELNGRNISGAFRADPGGGSLTGLVTGLRFGKNEIEASARNGGHERLTLTNYPITGPMISGPHEQPFICTTQTFALPNGSTLGAPLDANCSVATRVDYVYRTTGTPASFQPLPSPSSRPSDLASTRTLDGRTVPYIVRLETGTINRAIYQTAILHDPRDDPAPSPFAPPAGWNRKLIYPLGGGCQGGWYTQGGSLVNPLNDSWLSRGWAVASASLNTFGNNCNDLLSSETIIMVKERFIEAYGVPIYTIGTGSSGGAYQSNQTAENYPGTFDGIITMNTFPDVTTGMVGLHDARLLDVYFNQTRPGQYTEAQQKAISGYSQFNEIVFLSRSAGTSALRMDPVAVFPGVLPVALRYNPVTNPTGARATVYDHTVNVYGRMPGTGFARRPLDNVGVQYGLKALNDGAISVDQFLDLNDKIGGVDIDFKHIPQRTTADMAAVRRAYKSGRILNTGGGLATTPIIAQPGYGDRVVNGDIHHKYWSFSIRERLIKANGHADNQVIVGPVTVLDDRFEQMDRWLMAIRADTSRLSLAQKVVRNKPADVVDACWDTNNNKIVERQTAFGPGQCNTLYPASSAPGLVAGAPIALDIIKCRLKRIDPRDYHVSFDPVQWNRLRQIFPDGVCDWSKEGVGKRRDRRTVTD